MKLQFDKIGQCPYCGDNITNGHDCISNKFKPMKALIKKTIEAHTYNNELDILKKMCLYWMNEYEKLEKEIRKLKKVVK